MFFFMNIINYNLRGLGRPGKRFLIKYFLNLHFADVCCLQESKLKEVTPAISFAPARGSVGGIIIGWNSGLLKGQHVKVGVFSLTKDFLSVKENLWWSCTAVYGPNVRSLKPAFCEELRTCRCSTNIPWVVCGDFNAIFSIDDKRGGDRNLMDIRAATGFLQDMMLLEPPMIGRRFTWTNG